LAPLPGTKPFRFYAERVGEPLRYVECTNVFLEPAPTANRSGGEWVIDNRVNVFDQLTLDEIISQKSSNSNSDRLRMCVACAAPS
jgi:hypothetical protein